MDLAIKQLEPDIELNNHSCSSFNLIPTNGNSHTYRTDKPLTNDFRNYERLLVEINYILKIQLNKRQYMAVILYFSHGKVTITKVAESLSCDLGVISNAIAKARRIINEIL